MYSIKYSDDQPRGDDGRWTSGGGSEGDSVGGGVGRAGGVSPYASVDSAILDSSFYSAQIESAYVFDTDGNSIGSVSSGGEHTIIVDTSDEKYKDSTFIHNHPDIDGVSYTFSSNDIEIAVETNMEKMIATGDDGTYTMIRPANGWGDHKENMEKTRRKMKLSPQYVDDFSKYREGVFGDSPEQLNRISNKFWKTYADEIGATYTFRKRK